MMTSLYVDLQGRTKGKALNFHIESTPHKQLNATLNDASFPDCCDAAITMGEEHSWVQLSTFAHTNVTRTHEDTHSLLCMLRVYITIA